MFGSADWGFANPADAGVAVLVAAALVFARYLLMAGGALLVVKMTSEQLRPRRIQSLPFTRQQLLRELAYSLSTAGVFAGLIIGAAWLHHTHDVFALYPRIEDAGWLWFWASIPIAILMHDFYFYWAHRLMHLAGVYKRMHRVHHLSTNPSPLAALAFHPLEAVVEIFGVLLIAALLPMHIAALAIVVMISLLANVLGHLGYELFPAGFHDSALGRVLNTSTSHNQHHRTMAYNFGLYTLVWDRLFGTLHPSYDKLFARVTAGDPSSPAQP